MENWKEKLAGLGQELQAKADQIDADKRAVMSSFREILRKLEPIFQEAAAFGEVFGVECEWEISRFDHRHPFLRFQIRRPALRYVVECRDGLLHEILEEVGREPQMGQRSLEAMSPKRLSERIGAWVKAAAEANRKVPGGRKPGLG